MTRPPAAAPSREERLAAKLRENLRRRKAQARGMDGINGSTAAGAPHHADDADPHAVALPLCKPAPPG